MQAIGRLTGPSEPGPAPMAARISALRSEYQRAGDQRLVGGLDFVELVITADDQGDQGAFFGAMHHQGLDGFLDR